MNDLPGVPLEHGESRVWICYQIATKRGVIGGFWKGACVEIIEFFACVLDFQSTALPTELPQHFVE